MTVSGRSILRVRLALLAFALLMLVPATAHAENTIACTDQKPAIGFSFACDTALGTTFGDATHQDYHAFTVLLPPPDDNTAVDIVSFSVPGFQCKQSHTSVAGINCDGTTTAGQTVTGAISWKLVYVPGVHVPAGAKCLTGTLRTNSAAVNQYTLPDTTGSSDLQICQSSTPTSIYGQKPRPSAKKCTKGYVMRKVHGKSRCVKKKGKKR